MKILGIGVDIIENKRIKRSLTNINFKNRIYSPKELKQSKLTSNETNFFSKRFAAKEAFAKAMGTGFRNKLNFIDIEIINNKKGKPFFNINQKLNKLIKQNFKIKKFTCFLSISDEKDYSMAFVIIQST